MKTKQATFTVQGNHIPCHFTKTIYPYGTKFTLKLSFNKFKDPTYRIINVEINQNQPKNGWDTDEDVENFWQQYRSYTK